jgi:hypothetical protein
MSKRRKKREIQTIWIDDPTDDPVTDLSKFVALEGDRFAHLERWQEKSLQFIRLRLLTHKSML